MHPLELKIISSTSELTANAAAWNDLWQRSAIKLPVFRAEQLALWKDYFAPADELRAVVVADGSRWLAALPLVGKRNGLRPGVARLPSNYYSTSGELLYDQEAGDEVADALAHGLTQIPWKLLWLNFVAYEAPAWQALLAAAERQGTATFAQRSFDIGQVELDCDYRSYDASRSRNHRRGIHRASERLKELGGFDLTVLTPTCDDDLETLLRRGFEVEDRCWKSASGTSVLQSPGVFEFYVRQARELASHGQLKLVYLEHQGRPIAFEYAWTARGSYVSQKVGYDAEFAECSPGQLTRAKLYERFCETREHTLIDYRGVLSEATARWATRGYTVGRVLLGTRAWSKAIVRGYRTSWPTYLRLRTKLGRPPVPTFELRPLKRAATNNKPAPPEREPVAVP